MVDTILTDSTISLAHRQKMTGMLFQLVKYTEVKQ